MGRKNPGAGRGQFDLPIGIHALIIGAMKHFTLLAMLAFTFAFASVAADSEDGFKPIFNGTTFDGWKFGDEKANAWRIEEGALVAQGTRSHAFYVGDEEPFQNFELKVDVMTKPGSNGGIYFHTAYQESGWPKTGFECQVNVSQSDWIKTGSLYGLVNMALTPAQDNQWWTQHIIVQGGKVTVKIDGKTVLEYNEPAGAQPGKDFARKLNRGTFALQAHDPNSVVRYKNIRVKRL
jgi:hypothetical protein